MIKSANKRATKMASCDIESNFTKNKTTSKRSLQGIKPCHVLGVSKGVRNNLLFQDEETLIFPGGNHCVSYNIPQQHQEFLYSAAKSKSLRALAFSPDRRYLAVSECGKWASITILDLKDKKHSKKKVLKGSDYGVQEFVCMAFSADSEYLLGQAGGPSWTLYCWQWKKKELIASVQIKTPGDIIQVSFNPQDMKQVCVTGKGVFRIYEFRRGALKMADSYKVEKMNILCHTWMSSDSIIAGTEAGQLLILKSKRLQRMGKACERQTDSSSSPTAIPQTAITAILPYSDGFICSDGLGVVSLYEKIPDKDNYRKTVTLRIPVDPCSNKPLQAITSMCISPSEEALAISTDQGQLYHISLNSEELIKNKKTQFMHLSQSFHSGSITGLSVCATKPLMATCSNDRTVHIWNYHKKSLVQFKQFEEEPLSVSIHPNGLFVLVGFSTEVHLMKIYYDDLHTAQTFPISNCTECVFNHNGNKFAAIIGKMIHVYDIRTQKKLDLSGHHQQVQSLKWSDDDRRLVSCGMDGTVFVWDVLTGNAVIRNETASCFADVAFSPNTGSVLAVGRSHLQEISDEGVLYEMASDGGEYTAVSMTRSGRTVFIGTSAGTVRVIDYPFDKEKTWKEYQAHSGPITKMVVTPGDQYLLTASKDGCLFVWSIIDQNGQTIEKVKELDYTGVVLCEKEFLDKQDEMINKLTLHLERLEVEQEIAMTMMEIDFSEKMHTVLLPFQEKITSLKEKIQKLGAVKDAEKISYMKELTKLKENFVKEMNDQKFFLDEGPRVEFERSKEFKQKMKLMKESFEYKLQKAEENHRCILEEDTQAYEVKVQELEAELEQKIKTFKEEQQRFLEDALYEAMELSKDYIEDIQKERELRQMMEQEIQLMGEKEAYWATKSLEKDQRTQISHMKEEIMNMKDQLFEAGHNFRCLTKEKERQSQIFSEKVSSTEELKKIIRDLELRIEEIQAELIRVELEGEVADGEMQGSSQMIEINQLKNKLEEDKDMFSKIAAEMAADDKKYKKILSDLKRKVKAKAKHVEIQRQRLKSNNILLERWRGDVRNCLPFIQEDPKTLKEKFVELHRRYCHEADVHYNINCKISPADEALRDHHRQMDFIKRTQKTQKETHTRKMQAEKNRINRTETEYDFLSERLDDERMKYRRLMNACREKNIQCDFTPKPQYRPVIQPQPPAHPRVLLEKRRGQTFALEKRQGQTFAQKIKGQTFALEKIQGQQMFVAQKPTSSVKLPPIHPRKRNR
ncbi:cilia- and flagella-associated protein 57-like [Hemibagrus wyckioides]|uniref:cilia- and flagella-associated protein 57-like n=1 Tax=Hemibagrus wyckioides TaxID=337641 RepID=UPI00266B79E6|nr:cilia- and flagella-associated protein 57-like [Hemibagrus wyckioides]